MWGVKMRKEDIDPKIQKLADNQINYIRRMALLTDDQIREVILQQLVEHPHLIEKHTQEEQTKLIHDIKKAAKDVKTSPLKLARRPA